MEYGADRGFCVVEELVDPCLDGPVEGAILPNIGASELLEEEALPVGSLLGAVLVARVSSLHPLSICSLILFSATLHEHIGL